MNVDINKKILVITTLMLFLGLVLINPVLSIKIDNNQSEELKIIKPVKSQI